MAPFFGTPKNYGDDLLGSHLGAFSGGAAEDCPRATQGLKLRGEITGGTTGGIPGEIMGAIKGEVKEEIQGDIMGEILGEITGKITGRSGEVVGRNYGEKLRG